MPSGKKFWRLLGEMVETGTAWAPVAGAAQTSPYVPDVDATLVGIRVIAARQAATSLTNGVQIRLTCTTFSPNTLHVAIAGSGLQTAPAIVAPVIDYEVSQPVKSGVPITIEARNTYANAITPDNLIMGLFEV